MTSEQLLMNRRRLLGLALGGSASIALSSAPHVAAQNDGDPVQGGQLRLGLVEDPVTLNPYGTGGGRAKRLALRGLFDTLITYDEQGEWIPALAESWEVADDAQSVTFAIRQGVQFHDGTPCDAAAIKWVIDNLWIAQGGDDYLIAAAELLDDYSLRIDLNWADVTVIGVISVGSRAYIVSPTAYQELGADEFGLRPVGTGPFRFESWQRGVEVVMERNADYWQPDLPYLDRLSWMALPDDTIRRINLINGNIDVDTQVPLKDVQTLTEEEAIEVGTVRGGYAGLMLNIVDPPFDQLANREAFLAAIDYDAVVNAVYFGLADVSTGGFIAPLSANFNDTLPTLKRDLDLARAKLAEAGNPDGFELIGTFGPGTGETGRRLMEVIQATVSDVGIKIDLRQFDRARFSEILTEDRRAVQLIHYLIENSRPDSEIQLDFASCDATGNATGWCSEEFEQLLTEARGSTDPAARLAAVQAAEEVLIRDKAFSSVAWVPMAQAWRKTVQGFSVDYFGDSDWLRAWLGND